MNSRNTNLPNMLPSVGANMTADIAGLYRGVNSTLSEFNLRQQPSSAQSNPYLLANILQTAQQSALQPPPNAGSFPANQRAGLCMENVLMNPQAGNLPFNLTANATGMPYGFERPQTIGPSAAGYSFFDTSKHLTSAQYSQAVLNPFLAAAATNQAANVMLSNAFMVNQYNTCNSQQPPQYDYHGLSELQAFNNRVAISAADNNVYHGRQALLSPASSGSHEVFMGHHQHQSMDQQRSPYATMPLTGSVETSGVTQSPRQTCGASPAAGFVGGGRSRATPTSRFPTPPFTNAAMLSPNVPVERSPAAVTSALNHMSHSSTSADATSRVHPHHQPSLSREQLNYNIAAISNIIESFNNAAATPVAPSTPAIPSNAVGIAASPLSHAADRVTLNSTAVADVVDPSCFFGAPSSVTSQFRAGVPSALMSDDPFAALVKEDVHLDLDAALDSAGSVNHQFWEDLGDSVLEDALLLNAAVDHSIAGPSSLLHSVFEFPALQSQHPFDEMVAPDESPSTSYEPKRTCSAAGTHHNAASIAAPQRHQTLLASVIAASSIMNSNNDNNLISSANAPSASASMTPKLKDKMRRKERELAEIDRDFARHFNAVAAEKERLGTSSIISMRFTGEWVSLGTLTSDLSFRPSADLFKRTCNTNASHTTAPVEDGLLSPCTTSPFTFESEPLEESDQILTARFPYLTKYFLPNASAVTPEDEIPPSKPSATNATCSSTKNEAPNQMQDSSRMQTTSKWAPRKSKRVPIYKQQAPATARLTDDGSSLISSPCSSATGGDKSFSSGAPVKIGNVGGKKRHTSQTVGVGSAAAPDSPFSFTDEDQEEDEPKATSVFCGRRKGVSAKTELLDEQQPSTSREIGRPSGPAHGRKTRRATQVERAAARDAKKATIDERLVEEEVTRKLMQISSLHPELRLAISNSRTKTSSTGEESNASDMPLASRTRSATNQSSMSQWDFQDESMDGDEALRHVVPKKRLSVCTRAAAQAMQAANSSIGLDLEHQMSSLGSHDTKPSISDEPVVHSFLRTQIINDTETAKPTNYNPALVCRNSGSLALSQSSNPAPKQSQEQTAPLKPKLILRIPRHYLPPSESSSNMKEKIEEETDPLEGEPLRLPPLTVNLSDSREHRSKKHKHKKKKRKRDKPDDESKSRRKSRHSNEDGNEGDSLSSAEFNSSFSESVLLIDESGGSLSVKIDESPEEPGTSQTEPCVAPTSKISPDQNILPAVLSTNRKKMRWLHCSGVASEPIPPDSVEEPAAAPTDDAEKHQVTATGSATAPVCNGFGSDRNQSTAEERAPPPSQTPVFQKGAFVVLKSDLNKTDCPIWRVDSHNLLQRFTLIDHENRLVYQGTTTYAGWCPQNQDQYAAVQIKSLQMQNFKSDCSVRLERPLIDVFPAVSFEISETSDHLAFATLKQSDNNGLGILQELEHPLKEALQTYVHILILHCIFGNYLQTLRSRNDVDLLRQLNAVDMVNDEKKKRLLKEANWSIKFEEALDWFTYCTITEDDGSGLHCQACGRNIVENVIQLFANEGYDFDTLQPRQPKTTSSGSPIPSQDFHVCPSCADVAVLYHKLTHMRYHLYKLSLDKVDLIRGDNSTMGPAVIVDNCLKQSRWIVQALQEYLTIWSKIS